MRRLALVPVLVLAACGGEDVLPPPTGEVSGGLRITWTIEDGTDMTRTCEQARIDQVSIDIGRTPLLRPCTDGEVTFSNLLPDRYPIVARALAISGVARSTLMTNGIVTAGATVTQDLVFEIDPEAGQTGDLVVRWRIDGREPRTQCALVGADIARVVSGSGSIGSFEERVPCTETDIILRDLRPGVYVPQVILEKADGTRVATTIGEAVRVRADEQTDTGNINVVTQSGPPMQIVALWTVNSTAAPEACPTVNGRTVTFATVPPLGIVGTATTVPCSRGRAVLRDGVPEGGVDVRLTLQYGPASVTSTTVLDVPTRRAQTTTVTVDLEAL